jgi:hypothetical protein
MRQSTRRKIARALVGDSHEGKVLVEFDAAQG